MDRTQGQMLTFLNPAIMYKLDFLKRYHLGTLPKKQKMLKPVQPQQVVRKIFRGICHHPGHMTGLFQICTFPRFHWTAFSCGQDELYPFLLV